MVQLIPAAKTKPSFSEKLSGAIGTGLNMSGEALRGHRESEAVRQQGIDPNLPKEFQQLSYQAKLRKEQMANELRGTQEIENKDYDVISDRWGKQAADIWKASDPGAKTELVKHFLDQENREKQRAIPGNEGFLTEIDNETEEPNRKEKITDYDFGLTPKERTSRQNARYSTNLPLYQESEKKLQSLDSENYHLNILEELSPQITGLDRLNINPMTGEILIPAFASEAAQQFSKTINDFTVSAKDSYGSRVTNFDLNQFMKRLPNLANSEGGRKKIIEQMKIINDINSLREKTIHGVIDTHGGIRNIDYDQAERLANKKIKKETEELKKKFIKNNSSLDKEYSKVLKDFKEKIPNGSVAVRFNDGNIAYIPKNKLKEFINDKAGEEL